MKRFIRKQLLFIGTVGLLIGLLIFTALATDAMMCGSGSRGSGSDSGGHMEEMMEKGDHRGMNSGSGKQSMNQDMTQGAAESVVHQYLKSRLSEAYKRGELKDGGSYFMMEVIRSDGSVFDRLLIDKKTGNIHSLENL